MAIKRPVRIKGYAGQHDEGGAYIVDAENKDVCSTPSLYNFGTSNNPEAWREYYGVAQEIVDSLNSEVER